MIRTKHVLWVVALGLVVPLVAMANQTPQSTTPPAAHHHSSSKSHSAPKINLNTATKEQLMTLPGMTDDAADKIIAGRPFKSKDELVQKNIMTKEEMKKLESKVTTGNHKTSSTSTTKK
jgi:competence protein ComEA